MQNPPFYPCAVMSGRHYFWNPMYCPSPMSFHPWAGLSWGQERKRVCLYRPFCLPAEVTSWKVIRACISWYCYRGQFWFWAEKCLGKTEDVVVFVLLPQLWATACQSLFSAHAGIFCTNTIICKCVGLSCINWIPNCC